MWRVTKFSEIGKFWSKILEKLVLLWQSTCKCHLSLGKDLSDLFLVVQSTDVCIHLHLHWDSAYQSGYVSKLQSMN